MFPVSGAYEAGGGSPSSFTPSSFVSRSRRSNELFLSPTSASKDPRAPQSPSLPPSNTSSFYSEAAELNRPRAQLDPEAISPSAESGLGAFFFANINQLEAQTVPEHRSPRHTRAFSTSSSRSPTRSPTGSLSAMPFLSVPYQSTLPGQAPLLTRTSSTGSAQSLGSPVSPISPSQPRSLGLDHALPQSPFFPQTQTSLLQTSSQPPPSLEGSDVAIISGTQVQKKKDRKGLAIKLSLVILAFVAMVAVAVTLGVLGATRKMKSATASKTSSSTPQATADDIGAGIPTSASLVIATFSDPATTFPSMTSPTVLSSISRSIVSQTISTEDINTISWSLFSGTETAAKGTGEVTVEDVPPSTLSLLTSNSDAKPSPTSSSIDNGDLKVSADVVVSAQTATPKTLAGRWVVVATDIPDPLPSHLANIGSRSSLQDLEGEERRDDMRPPTPATTLAPHVHLRRSRPRPPTTPLPNQPRASAITLPSHLANTGTRSQPRKNQEIFGNKALPLQQANVNVRSLSPSLDQPDEQASELDPLPSHLSNIGTRTPSQLLDDQSQTEKTGETSRGLSSDGVVIGIISACVALFVVILLTSRWLYLRRRNAAMVDKKKGRGRGKWSGCRWDNCDEKEVGVYSEKGSGFETDARKGLGVVWGGKMVELGSGNPNVLR